MIDWLAGTAIQKLGSHQCKVELRSEPGESMAPSVAGCWIATKSALSSGVKQGPLCQPDFDMIEPLVCDASMKFFPLPLRRKSRSARS